MSKPKKKVLVSWVGRKDLDGSATGDSAPIQATLDQFEFDEFHCLYNYPQAEVDPFLDGLHKSSLDINAQFADISSPVDFTDIYGAAKKLLSSLDLKRIELSILLSPGTPAMQAVWILLGKTDYPCQFIQSSVEAGVQIVDIPFELSAEFIPASSRIKQAHENHLFSADVSIDAAFNDITTQNPNMENLKAKAQVLAACDVPVLIYGETGTGKELFARAIHNASDRRDQSFIAVNCGAIPSELVDSTLFGHKKGAFTGAVSDKKGVFEQANGGTLFLDEFGELPPDVQVRLLRVLQEKTFLPVGSQSEVSIDVRIVAATHRNLMDMVAAGDFREDLFYRTAVGVLSLPPLRDREGDLGLLCDRLLESIQKELKLPKGKKISAKARKVLLNHAWPGNVRELQSTLTRAVLWSQETSLSADDIQQALFTTKPNKGTVSIDDVSQGIDINDVVGDCVIPYIQKALEFTGGNKTKAAKLLGFKSHQTFTGWMEKYGITQP
jgi:transcriptional regulator with PAS, ATPase and Fis domain